MANNAEIKWKDRKRITFFGLPFSFTKYSLSEDRLFIEKGFFNTTYDEVRLYRISDTQLVRTLGQKIFGLGTIKVDSYDKNLGRFEIKNIRKSKEVKEMLSSFVETEREKKRVMSREILDSDDHEEDGYDENTSSDEEF